MRIDLCFKHRASIEDTIRKLLHRGASVKRAPKPKRAPALRVRLTLEDRALLRRCAELEGVTDVALVVTIVTAELRRRKRRQKRLARAAERQRGPMTEADRRQMGLFDFGGTT